MKINKTNFFDLFIIKHNVYHDDRGFFKETFLKESLDDILSYKFKLCQENIVRSKKNVLRGLHYQIHPHSQSKLISVEIGKILDVAVDIRKDSKTYGKYFSHIIDANNHESLFIPRGFAHGYLTISDFAIINYRVDSYYNAGMEVGIPFDDNFLKIDWGLDKNKLIISKKDKNHKPFKWT